MDVLEGKFLIIQNLGAPNEVIIHDSQKTFTNGFTSVDVLFATAGPTSLAGDFEDTCANGGNESIRGFFTFNITNSGSLPLQANWKIKKGSPIDGQYYSIPTEALMTKFN